MRPHSASSWRQYEYKIFVCTKIYESDWLLFASKLETMGTYRQQQLISELETLVEHLLTKSICEWQLVPHAQFALKPSASSWSANECLQHVNSYGRYYLPAIQKAIDKAATGSTENFHSGWLGNYFTKMMMPKENGSLATKMKSPKDHAPTNILESHQVIAEFIDQQEILLKLLRQSKVIDLHKVKVESKSRYLDCSLYQTKIGRCVYVLDCTLDSPWATGRSCAQPKRYFYQTLADTFIYTSVASEFLLD
ncbi:MAG: hypothetical protein ACOVMQ_05610 [Cyclobacteriaceae bacterium]|jgi:hypothetical protein